MQTRAIAKTGQAVLMLTVLAIAACSPPTGGRSADPAHNSQNALDWHGSYTGTTPCADCEGIRTTITLQANGTFTRERLYLGKSAEPVRDIGSFNWNPAGSVVSLASGSESSQQYQVGEDRLWHLDRSGNRITGDLADNYILVKTIRDPRIEDQRWALTEVMGQPVESSLEHREAFIVFDSSEGRFNGNTSCNNFFGSYVLLPGNRIRPVGSAGATRMACPDMTIESSFLGAMGTMDNYFVDGDSLSLHRGRAAPLLRFGQSTD